MKSRKIPFEGIANARDLGGLPCGDGAVVRSGCVIRCANLSRATDADIQKLQEVYRVQLILDLRTDIAMGQNPDRNVPGAVHLHMPVFDDAMIGVTHENDRDYARRKTLMPRLGELYKGMVTHPVSRRNFGKILTLIMENDFGKGAVIVHCSEGKDRAGLTSAFLLKALGVSQADILQDYLLTNEVNAARAESYYQQVLENGGTQEVAESVRSAFVAKEEYLEGAFEAISGEFPVFDDFLTEGLQIDRQTLAKFRETMCCKAY